ncbi:MAG TPA: transposase [Desulfuromonadaceae bacterium]
MSAPAAVYRPRNPQDSDYYRCVEDYFETFIQIYDEHFSRQYGFQTFGDFLGFNPHCHILVTDGCFYGDGGMFRVAPPLELKKLEAIFQHKVFRMLLDKGKISREMIAMLSSWRHSGFNVFCGNRISPDDDTAMENLARYIIRASFSQERMQCLDQEGTVVYRSKNGETTKSFPALEWLAAMCSHIPNRGEQMVRYYGYYSNVSRGKRQKEGMDDAIPRILEPQGNEKAFRKSWARLIQKIYEVNPLVCPKCQGPCGSSAVLRTRRSSETSSIIWDYGR